MSDQVNNLINDFFYQGNVCPVCSKGITIRMPDESNYSACPNCATFLGKRNGKFHNLNTFQKVVGPDIQLYEKCVIEGNTYEVISYRYCREQNGPYYWKEYTLHNARCPLLVLTEYNGHWILSELLTEEQKPKKTPTLYKVFLDKNFSLYNKYKILTVNAQGEFDSDIVNSPSPQYSEFIAPPDILTLEKGDGGENYWHGVYMQPSEVQALFPRLKMPERKGIGSAQPFLKGFPLNVIWTLFGLAIGLLVFFQILMVSSSSQKELIKDTVVMVDSSGFTAPFVSNTFKIENTLLGSTNLEYHLEANVENTWFETDAQLINVITGEEISFQEGVEYYSGYDYTEGSKYSSAILSAVPEGTYKLVLTPYKDRSAINQVSSYTYKVIQDVSIWRNFFLTLLALVVFPIAMALLKMNFENRRWAQSDFGS